MTPEQKQQILANAPPGATHCCMSTGAYYAQGMVKDFVMWWAKVGDFNQWLKLRNMVLFNNSIPLDSLREPDPVKPHLTERETILYDAIDAISSMCFEDYDYDYARAFSACQDAADNALSKFDGMESEPEPQRYLVVTALSAGIEHETLEKAENSAKHHAVKNPGMRIYVCKEVSAYCAKIEAERVK